MTSGILLVNKEVGISSQKCVYLTRKKLGIKKVGHTGTLDLEAKGLLPIVIGKATRVSDHLMNEKKEYVTQAFFGKETDTLDYSGKIINESSKIIKKSDLEEVIKEFIGEIEQVPPMYSALKINGQKLYDLARKGKEVERKKRKVHIYNIEIEDFSFPFASLKITCSKGTYIRSLVDDIGKKLETYAYVNELIRTKVGDFDLKDAINSEEIKDLKEDFIKDKILPIDLALKDYEKIEMDKSFF